MKTYNPPQPVPDTSLVSVTVHWVPVLGGVVTMTTAQDGYIDDLKWQLVDSLQNQKVGWNISVRYFSLLPHMATPI